MAGTGGEPLPLAQVAKRSIGILVGLGGLCCGLTVLYRSANAVMAIGGNCASGGSYVVAQPCPKGIAGMVPLSIIGGLVATAIYAFSMFRVGPRLLAFTWSALFLSLGWAFLDNGLHPGPDSGGTAWGFVVCAVLFGLMGGLPLYWLLRPSILGPLLLGGSEVPTPAIPGGKRRRSVWTTAVAPPGPAPAPGPSPAEDADDLVDALERLAQLFRSGAIDDAEFDAAKARLLAGEGSTP